MAADRHVTYYELYVTNKQKSQNALAEEIRSFYLEVCGVMRLNLNRTKSYR